MPGNYNALTGYGLNPVRPATRSARGDSRRTPGARRRRIELRHRHGRELLGRQRGHGNIGIDPVARRTQNMLVGIKPTVGRISRYGVIPITADQDTPGPMARTVADAADPARRARRRGARSERSGDDDVRAARRTATTRAFLEPDALKGARIGIPRAFFYDRATPPGATAPRGGLERRSGATDGGGDRRFCKRRARSIVDPADIPSVVDADASEQLSALATCCGLDNAKGQDAGCSIVFKYGMKRDFNDMAGVARAGGAGQDAHRAARSGTSPTSAPARSNTGRRSSTSRTRWTSTADRARY